MVEPKPLGSNVLEFRGRELAAAGAPSSIVYGGVLTLPRTVRPSGFATEPSGLQISGGSCRGVADSPPAPILTIMRARGVLILACLALASVGCSDSASSSSPPRAGTRVSQADVRPGSTDDLAVSARELVPRQAARTLAASELGVKECGIAPTFPCVQVLLILHDRGVGMRRQVESLQALAARKGWRVEAIKVTAAGGAIRLVRGRLHARYQLGRGLIGADEIATLTVVGPPNVTPPASAATKAGWTDARRRFVAAANAVCARTLGRGRIRPQELSAVVREAEDRLSALKAPPGDEPAVARIKRALHHLHRAVDALAAEHSEETLPAMVAAGEYAKRFDKAARRYGLDRCAAP